jgi:hypothetical protein
MFLICTGYTECPESPWPLSHLDAPDFSHGC